MNHQSSEVLVLHDDVIKWKHFPRDWPFVRGIHRSPVNSPHKGLWRGALMFPLICVWINGWVNNRKAGDLRRYQTHYDVIVMNTTKPNNRAMIGSDNGLAPLPELMMTYRELGTLRNKAYYWHLNHNTVISIKLSGFKNVAFKTSTAFAVCYKDFGNNNLQVWYRRSEFWLVSLSKYQRRRCLCI